MNPIFLKMNDLKPTLFDCLGSLLAKMLTNESDVWFEESTWLFLI